MARAKEFDEDMALKAAMLTFWSKGYAGTSLQDLEAAMHLTRTSIYNTFGNKRKLFERSIEHYKQTELAPLVTLLNQGHHILDDVRDMLEGVMALHFRNDTPGGCLVVLSLLEGDQHDVHSARMLKTILHDLQKGLKKRLLQAQHNAELNPQLDIATIAASLTSTITGIMVMGKAGANKAVIKRIIDAACHLLN